MDDSRSSNSLSNVADTVRPALGSLVPEKTLSANETGWKLHRRFDRAARLLSEPSLEHLARTHIMIVGCGGVGSFAAESLARTGVGKISLVDFDLVCVTNSNRQLHTMRGTIGKALARHLELPFIDADQEIVEHTGVSIATIFELEGEAGFRLREAQLIDELCRREGILLATGGGAVLREDNRVALSHSGIVIYLHASLDHLWQRTKHDSRRPLLQADNPR